MLTKNEKVTKAGLDVQLRLGEVVRSCRQKLGVTQDELAWRSNLHRTYIADIERGARNMTLRSIMSLAEALQVTVGQLLLRATAPAATGAVADARLARTGEILLIEDNLEDASMTLRAFKRARITNKVRTARDAEEGLALLFGGTGRGRQKPLQPQLILLDLNLPGMSGLDFLRRIKGDKRTREIPVVILTVSSSDSTIIECGRLGTENYIVKPFGIDNLIRLNPKLNLQLTLGPLRRARGGPAPA